MWFNIDLRSPMPIYAQIKRGIRDAILREKVKEGETLPSIREMASEIRVNPNTVARAYRELEMEGIIMARQGIGYIVLEGTDKIRESILENLEKQFKEPLRRLKKSGVELEELMEVIQKLWKD